MGQLAKAAVHEPLRPSWVCAGCHRLWPCPTRRAELVAEHPGRPCTLYLHLGACFIDAAGDLPTVEARELYARFIGWFAQ